MLHACTERFDVTENLENFLFFFWSEGLTEACAPDVDSRLESKLVG